MLPLLLLPLQDGVFSAAYSGWRSGYSPAQFLHTWWQLAGAAVLLRLLNESQPLPYTVIN